MSAARMAPVHMAVAFVGMGVWAAWANREHGADEVLRAGLVQGTISAGITLVLKQLVEAVAARLAGGAALFVPPALAWGASAAILSVIHVVAGTPEIAATIAVPNAVATVYAALYTYALWKDRAP
jgi:hypothetical protein